MATFPRNPDGMFARSKKVGATLIDYLGDMDVVDLTLSSRDVVQVGFWQLGRRLCRTGDCRMQGVSSAFTRRGGRRESLGRSRATRHVTQIVVRQCSSLRVRLDFVTHGIPPVS